MRATEWKPAPKYPVSILGVTVFMSHFQAYKYMQLTGQGLLQRESLIVMHREHFLPIVYSVPYNFYPTSHCSMISKSEIYHWNKTTNTMDVLGRCLVKTNIDTKNSPMRTSSLNILVWNFQNAFKFTLTNYNHYAHCGSAFLCKKY